ncbi:radical SAM family heme chaperone HemW [Algoriphagus sp. CAU 1675]|nr:radical SAM family heme chaperone HemW [Algoriphagus sp. CAU 1675]MDF2158885.1 radical SAM family heme chaperone HemW [Algoriphagus sp. CAU 1675]
MAGIYIHIPFCKQACHYCDFHFSTNTSRLEEMVLSIVEEMEMRKDYLNGEAIETIYFGGGTPSLPDAEQIGLILEKAKSLFKSSPIEVTLEANPDDLSQEKLEAWKALGIDRLSLGIQSFDDKVLRFYNRAHNSKESLQAIEKARKAGFEKFSIDLIYGFPYSDHSLWNKDLETALKLDPSHLSCYSLTVEPRTALGNWSQKGKFQPADEDFVAEQFEILQEKTEAFGYEQYEISNFAKPGQYAIHNTNYWKRVSYLGLGPGAHSFDGKKRGFNIANNALYLKHIQTGQLPFETEELSESDLLNEYILTGLRTSWGIDLDLIREDFKTDLFDLKKREIEQMGSEGWLIWKDKNLSLSKSGKILADSIAEALFI